MVWSSETENKRIPEISKKTVSHQWFENKNNHKGNQIAQYTLYIYLSVIIIIIMITITITIIIKLKIVTLFPHFRVDVTCRLQFSLVSKASGLNSLCQDYDGFSYL